MKNRKTALFLMLSLVSALVTGCGMNVNAEYTKDDKLSIVTTCFPPYDYARAVTGDSDITMLLCPGAEAHSYEPTPLDILKIQECDVFIYIGGAGEVWAEEILSTMDTSEKQIIKLSDHAELLEEVDIPGANNNGHSHSHHHHHDEECEEEHNHEEESEEEHSHEHSEECSFDEHIWTSPDNAIEMTQAICEVLCKVDTEKSELYKFNTSKYVAELEKLDADFDEMTENAPKNTIVIGDRFPFRYLAHEYGFEYYSAFSGCSSETEPGVYTMAFLIDRILESNIENVFYLEFSTKKVAEKLSYATGADMLQLHSCHNVSTDDFKNEVTYIDLMRKNLESLKEALY